MVLAERSLNIPPLILDGDAWAQAHPEEHADELKAARDKEQILKQKLNIFLLGDPIELTFDDFDLRTTRDRLNEQDLELRKKLERK